MKHLQVVINTGSLGGLKKSGCSGIGKDMGPLDVINSKFLNLA